MAVLVIASSRIWHVGVSCAEEAWAEVTADDRYGTFVFNGLISPACFAPPQGVHLPHEPELEETGEVPAAQGQGRAGYDVVPTNER